MLPEANELTMRLDEPMATESEVRATVEAYFLAIHAGDTQTLRRLFAPTATLIGWDEGELKCVTRDRWCAFVESTPSPKSHGAPLDGEILHVDISGTAALAKVREVYLSFEYVEFLNLVWTGDRWEIVHKCYHQFKPQTRGRP